MFGLLKLSSMIEPCLRYEPGTLLTLFPPFLKRPHPPFTPLTSYPTTSTPTAHTYPCKLGEGTSAGTGGAGRLGMAVLLLSGSVGASHVLLTPEQPRA